MTLFFRISSDEYFHDCIGEQMYLRTSIKNNSVNLILCRVHNILITSDQFECSNSKNCRSHLWVIIDPKYIGWSKSSRNSSIFIQRNNVSSIALHHILEIVVMMFRGKFHPFNSLLRCLFEINNRDWISLFGYRWNSTSFLSSQKIGEVSKWWTYFM